jgi:serine/threonine protein kinase
LALTPGTRLGVYEVIEQIGEGGMGQVYRARDTKLGRDVALKILPDAVAQDADRVARFKREAQVLASLNHPHIAAIYGFDEAGTTQFLILELVEGETLADRLKRGPIPVDETIVIARQIAEALAEAHEKGIIHRDLKPANIALSGHDQVKVLDFGLAKLAAAPAGGASSSVSMSPTLTTPAMMTGVGMILGTAAYMAPEQAKGREADKRCDVWAFGCVVYEMLTAKRAFEGEDITDTIASIMRGEPDWTALPADTPANARLLLESCLTKDRKHRAADVSVVQFLLDDRAMVTAKAPTPYAAAKVPAWRRALPWAITGLACAAALALLALWAPWRFERSPERPLVRLDVDLGADVSLPAPSQDGSSVVISPDGTSLLYASGTPAKLFIRRLDQPKAVELPGTEGASSAFFSPDGRWVGFFAGRGANKISVEGGAVVPLGDTAPFRGASWDADGTVVVGVGQGLARISAAGGSQALTETGAGELWLLQPQVLPGGRAILFEADNPGDVDKTTIQVLSIPSRQKKTVLRGGASPRYVETPDGAGYLLYVNKTTLFAVPFDLKALELRGTAVPLVNDVAAESLIGVGQFDVSRTGTFIYRRASGASGGLTTLQWVDSTGKRESLRAAAGTYLYPRLSPDGKQVALTVIGRRGMDVWTYDLQRDAMTRLTFSENNNRPIWSPDGRHIVFATAGGALFQVRADGASQPQVLTQGKEVTNPIPSSFTPDGKRFVYTQVVPPGIPQLWTVPLEERDGQLKAGTPELLQTSANGGASAAAFSPDGHWVAYQSAESGTSEVFVRAFPPPASGQGSRWQISNSGGGDPRWSSNGHELLYRAGDQIMSTAYTSNSGTFVAEKPKVWLNRFSGTNGGTAWDLAPDGKRVAVVTPVESADASKTEHEVVFLLNFFDELRRRVTVGK